MLLARKVPYNEKRQVYLVLHKYSCDGQKDCHRAYTLFNDGAWADGLWAEDFELDTLNAGPWWDEDCSCHIECTTEIRMNWARLQSDDVIISHSEFEDVE